MEAKTTTPKADAALRGMVEDEEGEMEMEWLRAAIGTLDEAWDSIYNIRGLVAAYADGEDSYRLDGVLRELRNALDGITEAEAKLASEVSSRRKKLARLG